MFGAEVWLKLISLVTSKVSFSSDLSLSILSDPILSEPIELLIDRLELRFWSEILLRDELIIEEPL